PRPDDQDPVRRGDDPHRWHRPRHEPPHPGVRGKRRPHGHARRAGLATSRRVATVSGERRPLPSNRRARRAVRVVCGATLMRDVAIISSAQMPNVSTTTMTPVEMLLPGVNAALTIACSERTEIVIWGPGSGGDL